MDRESIMDGDAKHVVKGEGSDSLYDAMQSQLVELHKACCGG